MPGARARSLALLLLLTSVQADTGAAPPSGAPALRLTRLGGRVEIEPDAASPAPAARLPYLRAGSIVRVLEGTAAFDSDIHATVRAGEGDCFRFLSSAAVGPAGGPTLRVAAVEREPRALEVSVGDYKFRLRKGGALSISTAWPGELVVRADARGVELAPGSATLDGKLLSSARRLEPGQGLHVAAPESPGFENTPADAAALSVRGADEGRFVVSSRPAEAALRVREAEARRIISDWPVVSLRTAEVVIEKYGPPDLALSDRLSWFDAGPWRTTTVYRDPREHLDVLEQTIGYRVPEEKAGALAALDVNLRRSRDGRELSAASEAEETNFLALNMADEVVREVKTPAEARALYLRTVVEWNAGRSSPYMKGLRFR